jgi:hypothetical protein
MAFRIVGKSDKTPVVGDMSLTAKEALETLRELSAGPGIWVARDEDSGKEYDVAGLVQAVADAAAQKQSAARR